MESLSTPVSADLLQGKEIILQGKEIICRGRLWIYRRRRAAWGGGRFRISILELPYLIPYPLMRDVSCIIKSFII